MELLTLFAFLLFAFTPHTLGQSTDISSTIATPASPSSTHTITASNTTSSSPTSTSSAATSEGSPNVHLYIPNLSVGRIELDVDQLSADINLNAAVAGLVTINAGIALSVQSINLTITDVEAELELNVRLSNLVSIVNRIFQSLDLNPLLISAINDVTSVVDDVVGAVDGLLGSITQGGTTLSFIVDNLGNIVQEVSGVSSIVGNYLTNMTATGAATTLSNGNTKQEYEYSPLSALVYIVFNSAGQVVQATVVKSSSTATATASSSTSTAAPGTTTAA